jgi:solute carrier family 25 protein 16
MLPYAGMSFLTHDTIGDLLRHPAIAQYTVLPSTKLPSKKSRAAQAPRRAQLTAGAIAGLVSQTASYPFEVIRRRMQVGGAVGDGHRMSMAETARKIFMERGLKGFFVGLTIGYIKVVS